MTSKGTLFGKVHPVELPVSPVMRRRDPCKTRFSLGSFVRFHKTCLTGCISRVTQIKEGMLKLWLMGSQDKRYDHPVIILLPKVEILTRKALLNLINMFTQ